MFDMLNMLNISVTSSEFKYVSHGKEGRWFNYRFVCILIVMLSSLMSLKVIKGSRP